MLRQGGVLSQTLFGLQIDKGITNVFQDKNLHINFGNVKVNNLLWVDDIVYIGNSDHLIDCMNTEAETFRLKHQTNYGPEKKFSAFHNQGITAKVCRPDATPN